MHTGFKRSEDGYVSLTFLEARYRRGATRATHSVVRGRILDNTAHLYVIAQNMGLDAEIALMYETDGYLFISVPVEVT